MSISKYSRRIVTYLRGKDLKEFTFEQTREHDTEAQTARALIKLGLQKLKEDRDKTNNAKKS